MSTESKINTLVLKLLFNGFSYPEKSRFISIFSSSKKLKNAATNKKSLNIEPQKVVNGKDKRTSIIIKNLPYNIKKDDLKCIIEPLGNINFIYIPILNKNKNSFSNSLPCAYINVINYKTILKIIKNFNEIKNNCLYMNRKDFTKVEIFYSGTQGKHDLIKRFSFEKKFLLPMQKISFS